ncbi:hypothetical protein D3C81_1910160 [compost metagenome]
MDLVDDLVRFRDDLRYDVVRATLDLVDHVGELDLQGIQRSCLGAGALVCSQGFAHADSGLGERVVQVTNDFVNRDRRGCSSGVLFSHLNTVSL